MSDVTYSFPQIPIFARAMKLAAPKYLLRAMGKALFKVGKSDTEKMKAAVSGAFRIKSKSFVNSFKFKATDSRAAQNINQLQLSEYTGAKPFRIFQTGGDIQPTRSRLMTILAPAARTASGKRKYSPEELRSLVASGQAKIIQTKSGPAIVQADERYTKSGKPKVGSKMVILAWLRPHVTESQRIDFFGNYERNSDAHEAIFNQALNEAIEKTIADEDEGD